MIMQPKESDTALLALLEIASRHVMTPEEKAAQRISFAAGNLAMHTGEEVSVVRERMEKLIEEMG